MILLQSTLSTMFLESTIHSQYFTKLLQSLLYNALTFDSLYLKLHLQYTLFTRWCSYTKNFSIILKLSSWYFDDYFKVFSLVRYSKITHQKFPWPLFKINITNIIKWPKPFIIQWGFYWCLWDSLQLQPWQFTVVWVKFGQI